jgi:hypothetical protein
MEPWIGIEWEKAAGRPTIDIGTVSIHFFPRKGHVIWGYKKDWYDGPHHLFGLGPLMLIAVW